MQGEKVGDVEIRDEIFMCEVKPHLIHDVIRMQQANHRRGTSSTKTRKEVRGGGRKPFRQKGTGRARQGSSRSPLQVGGGTVFGPHPRDYSYTLPKKVRKSALKSALTVRNSESNLKIIDKLALDRISTKAFYGVVKALKLTKPLFVVDGRNEIVEKSVRNIPFTKVLKVEGLNVYDIIRHEQLILTMDALKKIEEVLGS
jgi:large subunit ribosomal protein L4